MSRKSNLCASVLRGFWPLQGWCAALFLLAGTYSVAAEPVNDGRSPSRSESLPLARPSGSQTSIFESVSPPANAIRDLFYLVAAITGVIFLLVGFMLVYCIVRFRQRRAATSESSGGPGEPPQIYGSQPIELAWTVGALLTVFVLLMVVIRSVAETRRPEPQPGSEVLRVRVIGHRWWWEYQYLDIPGLTTANEMHVPASVPGTIGQVHLELQSADVVHSFWVPQLAGKLDLIPGRTNKMWFETAQEGIYRGQCAEYCGTQHANMLLRVVVDSPDEFQRWAKQQASPQQAKPEFAAGEKVFLARTCVNCHAIRGTAAHGTVGPDLTHLATRMTLAAGAIENNPEQLAAWLHDPQTIKPGCDMPSLRLTKDEIRDLVAYLGSLK